jgi:hypothetical protein
MIPGLISPETGAGCSKRRVMLHYGIMLMTAYEDGLPLKMEGTEEDKYLK